MYIGERHNADQLINTFVFGCQDSRITLVSLYRNLDTHAPHFYMAKMGFTGICFIFQFLL